MRPLIVAFVFAVVGCGPSPRSGGGGGGAADADTQIPADACVGLECRIDDCAAMGMPDTTISGTVFAPNGSLALFGVNVYIPAGDPRPLTDGVSCGQCQSSVPEGSIGAVEQSDTAGHFRLSKVPSGINIPLVIQVGKWRRVLNLASVTACTDNPLPPSQTSLPRNKTQGDLPMIAITTGSCDALECLIRKLGIDQSEFTAESGTGRVHLYASSGVSSLSDGTALTSGNALWGDLNKLKKYDIAAFSCECGPHSATPAMTQNVKSFADLGGRVFMSHYHSSWIRSSWPSVANCNVDNYPSDPSTGIIDQVNNPKGMSFVTWMQSVQAATPQGQFTINGTRQSCTTLDASKAERWVYLQSSQILQNFQFTTPQEDPAENRCGKVVFSDMHVASDSSSSGRFPNGCSSSPMTAQEKAIAFMFFDISSCIGPIL
jgi:hypothetical protein